MVNNRNLIVCVTCCFVIAKGATSYGQARFVGRLIDDRGHPVAGQTIRVLNGSQDVTTKSGEFAIVLGNGLEAGDMVEIVLPTQWILTNHYQNRVVVPKAGAGLLQTLVVSRRGAAALLSQERMKGLAEAAASETLPPATDTPRRARAVAPLSALPMRIDEEANRIGVSPEVIRTALLRWATERNPTDQFEAGLAAFVRGELDVAISHLEKERQIRLTEAAATSLIIANIRMMKGQTREALAEYLGVVNTAPSYAAGWVELASLCTRLDWGLDVPDEQLSDDLLPVKSLYGVKCPEHPRTYWRKVASLTHPVSATRDPALRARALYELTMLAWTDSKSSSVSEIEKAANKSDLENTLQEVREAAKSMPAIPAVTRLEVARQLAEALFYASDGEAMTIVDQALSIVGGTAKDRIHLLLLKAEHTEDAEDAVAIVQKAATLATAASQRTEWKAGAHMSVAQAFMARFAEVAGQPASFLDVFAGRNARYVFEPGKLTGTAKSLATRISFHTSEAVSSAIRLGPSAEMQLFAALVLQSGWLAEIEEHARLLEVLEKTVPLAARFVPDLGVVEDLREMMIDAACRITDRQLELERYGEAESLLRKLLKPVQDETTIYVASLYGLLGYVMNQAGDDAAGERYTRRSDEINELLGDWYPCYGAGR